MNRSFLPRRVLVLTLALAPALACGGSNSTDPGGSNGTGTPSCTVTLTGALTGSPTCSHLSADRTDNDGKTSFGFEAADGTDTVRVAVGFSGAPTTTTYNTGTGADAVLLINNGSTLWTTDPSVGSWSLTFSSVKATSSGAGITGYEVHGTFAATLLPAITETTIGPVTLNATF